MAKFNKVELKHLRKLEKIADALDLQKPIKVSVRKKGKLSNGIVGKCHNNVCEVVKHLGGKQVVGYYVQRQDDVEQTALLHHSIWLSPEGKYVDVTYGQKEYWNDIYFYPQKTYDPLTEFYQSRNNWIIPDDIHQGVWIQESYSGNTHNVPMNFFTKLSKAKKKLKRNNQLDKFFKDNGWADNKVSLVNFDDVVAHKDCDSHKSFINEFGNYFNFKNYQNDKRVEAI